MEIVGFKHPGFNMVELEIENVSKHVFIETVFFYLNTISKAEIENHCNTYMLNRFGPGLKVKSIRAIN